MFHHANEKVAAVRLRAAKLSKCSPEAVELRVADETLVPNNDNKLLNLSQVISLGINYCICGADFYVPLKVKLLGFSLPTNVIQKLRQFK